MVSGNPPVFVNVTVWVALVVPTVWETKVSDALLRDAAGAAAITVKLSGEDSPPPGAGLDTAISSVPACAISAAVMFALSCVALTKVVVRAPPFHCTTAPFTKLDPVTLNVNPGPPNVALVVLSEASTGSGFWPVAAPEMLLRSKINVSLPGVATKLSTRNAKPFVPQRTRVAASGPKIAGDTNGTVPSKPKLD